MPFEADEVYSGFSRGIEDDGHWHSWIDIRVRATALHRLGLHPSQPTSTVTGPTPPAWWHAAAERRFR